MDLSNLVEEPEKRIKDWLNQIKNYRRESPLIDINKLTEGIEEQIKEEAYYLSLRNLTYEDLCWILAEKKQKEIVSIPTFDQIRQMAAEIFNMGKSYEELCWLNAEFDILKKE